MKSMYMKWTDLDTKMNMNTNINPPELGLVDTRRGYILLLVHGLAL